MNIVQKNTQIISLTTDPYDNIFGYALVFFQLFDFIERNDKTVQIILISNDGYCSKLIANPHFVRIKLNPNSNRIFKTMKLILGFMKGARHSSRNTIIVANSELPELISAWLLKFNHKRVFCFVHDYNSNFRSAATLYELLRKFLLARIGNVIVLNHDHQIEIIKDIPNIKCYIIPNPVFVEGGAP